MLWINCYYIYVLWVIFYYIMVYECENIEDNILLYFGKYLYY